MSEYDIELRDLDDWIAFVEDNRDDLEETYGSVGSAYRHLLDGGLTVGGGAAPMFNVYFVED